MLREVSCVKLEELVDRVAPEWRSAFVRFIETGDADETFLDYLDRDKEMQEAVELAFTAQSQALEGLAHALQGSDTLLRSGEAQAPAAQTADAIARVLEAAVLLRSEDRSAVLESAMTNASRDLIRTGEPGELQETLADLKRAVGAAEAVVGR